jgi:hypothetical protein
MPDFTTPIPNDTDTIRSRNSNLSVRLAGRSDDITDVYLETMPSGSTRWRIVYRSGDTDTLTNPKKQK